MANTVQMTKEEWKKIHRDFKTIMNGCKMTMRNGMLVAVEIVERNGEK